jgi:hypothetical protein
MLSSSSTIQVKTRALANQACHHPFEDSLTDVKPNKDVHVALAIVQSVKPWMIEIQSDLKRDSQ